MKFIGILLFVFSAAIGQESYRPDSDSDADTVAAPDSGPKPASVRDSVPYLGLAPVVVTTSRAPRLVRRTPVDVSVISDQVIEAAPARNVDDLLVAEKGLVLKRPVGMGEGVPSDILIRGVPGAMLATRTLILVDGIPTNASGTPFLILNEIPMQAVERIEIVRGPFSSLYGANAFSGVIHVITEKGDGPPRLDLTGELGNFAFWDLGAWVRGGVENASWSITGSRRAIDNYVGKDRVIVRGENGYRYKSSENHDYEDLRFFGKGDWELAPGHQVTLQGRFFESDLGFGISERLDDTPIGVLGRKITVAPGYNWDIGPDFRFEASSYFRQLEGEYLREALDSDDSLRQAYWSAITADWQGEARLHWRPGYWGSFTLGGDLLRNQIDFGAMEDAATGLPLGDSRPVETAVTNAGLYLQAEVSPNDRWVFTPSLRWDHHSEFGMNLSPKGGLLFELSRQVSLRASAGKGFRAPALSEQFMPDLMVSPSITLQSNPDLWAETMWAYDIGALFFLDPFLLEASGFYNDMDNLITPQLASQVNSQGRFEVTFDNTRASYSYGGEGQVTFRPAPMLDMFANYTYTQSVDEELDDALDLIPKHRANFGWRTRHRIGAWILSSSLTEAYVGERSYRDWNVWNDGRGNIAFPLDRNKPMRVELKSYYRTDLSLKAEWRSRLWVLAAVQNLLDADFEEAGGNIAPGRLFWLKLGVGL